MMKNSGLEWLGNIPYSWGLSKIAQAYIERTQKVSDTEYAPLSVTMKGIVPQLENAAKSDAHDARKLVMAGDFVINSRSDRRGSCGISPYNGSVSLINTVLAPRGNINSRYYDWLFHTALFADEFYKYGHGIVDDLWTTKWQDMKKITIPMPSLSEQQAIADYLDDKCGAIDSVIAKQRDIIERLREYKNAVIAETVCRGLDPNTPMKDSGIEWIGQIPAHWEVAHLKYFATSNNGAKVPQEVPQDYENAIPVYGSGGIFKYTTQSLYSGETVMFGRKGTLGKPLYITGIFWTVDTMYWLNNFHNAVPKFIYYLLVAFDWSPFITQTALPSIVATQIMAQAFPFPNIEEQQKIVGYLNSICAGADMLIAKRERLIELLTEYKHSLIYECVTGKKEVVNV